MAPSFLLMLFYFGELVGNCSMRKRERAFLGRGTAHVKVQRSKMSGWTKELQAVSTRVRGAGEGAREALRRNGHLVSFILQLTGAVQQFEECKGRIRFAVQKAYFGQVCGITPRAMLEEMRQVGRLAQSSRWGMKQAWTGKMAKGRGEVMDMRCLGKRSQELWWSILHVA